MMRQHIYFSGFETIKVNFDKYLIYILSNISMWSPCYYYDEWYNDYEGKTFEYAYAYEENPSEEELDAVRSLDRKRTKGKNKNKRHH